ncbi:hypothetical protein BKA58DRAFT_406631 [Alternaria rosae]|uniref:uncharacterized protein n=1 Tax=Alternaria rosae TaxID=1187941 RepID=UPI001E8D090A|nr:uncharacterized protein BKA58DRAFT_406631 [Alternaria rosae]KAH6851561.1 hypothetical protein BKA58DRAFT_406631 [Alternaria rosae]
MSSLTPTPTPTSLAPSGTVAIISGTPYPTPLTCQPHVARNMYFSDVSGQWCTYALDPSSGNETIPYLASCCKEGAEVKMWQDCMLYCEVTGEQRNSWRDCVEEIYPEAKTDKKFNDAQACYGLKSEEVEDVQGPNGTRAVEAAQSRTAVGSAAATGDGEGAASLDRPSLTLGGWMVAFLAVAAGFLG